MIDRPLLLWGAMILVACGGADPATPRPRSSDSTEPSTAPRRVRATRDQTVVELSATPGLLVDGNAPPPPPGSPRPTHPALSGSCSGDPHGCSDAGEIVRSASTFDDAIAQLRAHGFEIDEP